jgi:FxLD family lantipeptide
VVLLTLGIGLLARDREEKTMLDTSVGDAVDLDLDVTIVVTGPPAAALLGSTDDGCDTRKDGDC